MVAKYSEIAGRAVTDIGAYTAMERDFVAINAAHWKQMRLPPSLAIPVTADNLSAKAADLQKVAKARIDNLRAAGCQ
jgi:hypothetical protein